MTTPHEQHATSLQSHRARRIEPQADPAFTPQIGALVDMLIYARLTTLQAAQGLTLSQLDAIPAGFSNSIGMLLAHIAAVHHIYHGLSFEGRDIFHDAAFAPYLSAMTFGEKGGERVQGQSLDWYVAQLELAQTLTLAGLAKRNDEWLASHLSVPNFDYPNHHWAWFHVMEDEVNHRGQIRILRKIVAPKA